MQVKADYRRVTPQTTRVTDNRLHIGNYRREAKQNVNANAKPAALFSFFRQCLTTVGNVTWLSRQPLFFRTVNDRANLNTETSEQMGINRVCEENAFILDDVKRNQIFNRLLTNIVNGIDNNNYSIVFVRTVNDTKNLTDRFLQIRNYIRFLYVEAGSNTETAKWGNSYRAVNDTVQVEGSAFRHLLIFIKLVSTSFVRDFVLRRFLIARKELILKSYVSREIILESKIG
jgi:hypothetical protein